VARHTVVSEPYGWSIEEAHYEVIPRGSGRTAGHAVGVQTTPEVQTRSLDIYDRLVRVSSDD